MLDGFNAWHEYVMSQPDGLALASDTRMRTGFIVGWDLAVRAARAEPFRPLDTWWLDE